jgi:hypothetical protein
VVGDVNHVCLIKVSLLSVRNGQAALTDCDKMADNRWDDDRGNADILEIPQAVAQCDDIDALDSDNIFTIVVLTQGSCPEEHDDEPDAACKLDEEADNQNGEEGFDHRSLFEDGSQKSGNQGVSFAVVERSNTALTRPSRQEQ